MRRLVRQWRRWRRLAGKGGAELFVYGECICGWYCMLPEGARWPLCVECGRQVMPPLPGDRRLEAAVVLVETKEAVEEVRRIGAVDPPRYGGERRFGAEDCERWLRDRAESMGCDADWYIRGELKPPPVTP